MGPRERHLAYALRRLAELGEPMAVSGVYETEPLGFRDQPPFLNLVVRLRTRLGPAELLRRARGIEGERRRVRTFRNAPRTLDIDILLYGDRVVDREGLTVPHPRMTGRAFVLVPLLELAPDLVDPRSGRRYAEHLADLEQAAEKRAEREAPASGAWSSLGVRRVMEVEELLEELPDEKRD